VPDNSPQVTVVVVTHDSLPALTGCLNALANALEKIPCELIVIDNASRDQTVAEVTRLFPYSRVISNTVNVGFARACNQGAEGAIGEYLLFLNPDVELDAGAVATLVAESEAHPEAGLVSGRLRNSDGTFQPTSRRFPTIGNMIFSRGSALSGLFSSPGPRNDRYTLQDSPETTEVPAVAATMVMVSRALFAKAGGFDQRFFMFMEDTDLSIRLYQLGYRNLFVPAAGGVHHWGKGARAGRARRAYYHHVSLWKYFLKHFPNGFSVILLPLLLLANFILVIMMPARGRRSGDG
jgi:N-acetylglucosaminyl-diphospho-decaprenol L-rhamnosyltransferase